jgi:asparagine synthase (glutamine-hydrolysing)
MFEGIVNLPPATFAWVDVRGELRPQTYWRLPTSRKSEREISYEEAQKQLAEIYADSVGIRLRADVPLAAELSGGMDSTTLVALAARRLRGENAPHRLQTFTVRYGDPKFDESGFAKQAADMAGAEFNPLELTSGDYWDAAADMMHTLEQPYESPNLLGCRAMWTTMKGLGIRVVLNGGAGDELLAGYIESHLFPFLRELAGSGQWSAALRESREWRGTSYFTAVKARRYALHQLPGPLRRSYVRRAFRLPEFSAFTPPPGGDAGIVGRAAARAHGGLSKVLSANITTSPIPMYVVQSDKLAMSVPIEVRYPFLDHRLMDFAFQLPLTHLIRGGRSKAVLRDAARGLVPDAVINRREKMGFPVPLRQWMHEGAQHIRSQLGKEPRSRRFIDPAAVLSRTELFSEAALWRIHQVELWMKTFDLS